MTMSRIWTFTMGISLLWGAATGRWTEIGTAAMEGAGQAVTLSLGICGAVAFWCGVMEITERAGIMTALSKLLSPVLKKLFPSCEKDGELLKSISGNVTANFLGLGNAATPLGLAAVGRMAKGDRATDEMCRLIVINTASIQLIPATVAAVRSAAGCETPFDILPAVWLSSAVSVAVGITAARIMGRCGKWR